MPNTRPDAMPQSSQTLQLTVDASHRVSAVLDRPDAPRAVVTLAHGAGAGMEHPSMRGMAMGLVERGIATLRFQFPYMEQKIRRPDPPALCHATVRAAIAEAARLAPDLPLFAGGRSFGGRMTSQAQAQAALPGVRGLFFLAFPLHPPERPGNERAVHLDAINIPMLFVQGTRDELARLELLQPVVRNLGERATLHLLQNADHAFHVPARSGRKDAAVLDEALDALSAWTTQHSTAPA